MTTKVSSQGEFFISTWSLFSKNVFRIEQNLNNTLYIGYCYYGGPLPYKVTIPFDKDTTFSSAEALDILRQELIGPNFDFVQDFDFNRFKQHELDALISICTTHRTSDYFEWFKTTSVYKALKDNLSAEVIADLIKNDIPTPDYLKDNPKKYGIFYSMEERRAHEANLFLNADYSPCPGLTAKETIVDGILVFY